MLKEVLEKLPKEEIQKYYESNLVSLLEAIDLAGRRIAGRGGEVFLREVGYALSDVGFKKLPVFKKPEDACRFLEELWEKLRTVGRLFTVKIEEREDYTEIIIGFEASNCSITVERKNLKRGSCPLCRMSMYFMERNFSRLLNAENVSVGFYKYENGICYERVRIFRR
ncbi:MAG: hypothetical protein GXO63_01500 [Candidatus Micrarchaeota archaeon]|nr:hypothetical protein [Candidatus Micrarchaeota archaeon]